MDKKAYSFTILAFSDASKPSGYGKVVAIIGLLDGKLQKGSIFIRSHGFHISENAQSKAFLLHKFLLPQKLLKRLRLYVTH